MSEAERNESELQTQEQVEDAAQAEPVSVASKGTPQSDQPENSIQADPQKNWYILKVQVNREDHIKRNLERRIAIAGLDDYFGEILVPTEKVTEIRGDKKRIVKRKLYPGYIMIFMEINNETWFLVRETAGIGDFTGAVGKPTPMLPHEVQRILASEKEDPAESPKLKVGYEVGARIKVNDGTFANFEGVVDAIDFASGRVTVIINLFGRSTPVELEYWQIEVDNG